MIGLSQEDEIEEITLQPVIIGMMQFTTKPIMVSNMFNMSLIIMWYILWFSNSPWLRYELWKIWRAANCGNFLRKLTSKAGKNEFVQVWSTMSLLKCPIPWDVKFHWAQCVKAITIRWSQFQSVSSKPLKLCLTCKSGLLLLVAIWQHNQQRVLC